MILDYTMDNFAEVTKSKIMKAIKCLKYGGSENLVLTET